MEISAKFCFSHLLVPVTFTVIIKPGTGDQHLYLYFHRKFENEDLIFSPKVFLVLHSIQKPVI